jgi:hypothetical protein
MQEDYIAVGQRYHRLDAEIHTRSTVLVDANPTHGAGYAIGARLIVGAGNFQVTAPHELLILSLFQQLAEQQAGVLLRERALTGTKAQVFPDTAIPQSITQHPDTRPDPEQKADDNEENDSQHEHQAVPPDRPTPRQKCLAGDPM